MEDAGFDAIIGNPPYVSSRNEAFYEDLRGYIDLEFELAVYQVDTYNLFVETAHELIKKSGLWSYIIPDTWMGDVTGENFRRWLTNETDPVTFGIPVQPVFDADVDCAVIVIGKDRTNSSTEIWDIGPRTTRLTRVHELNNDGHPFVLTGAGKLLNKIEEECVELDEVALTGRGIGPYHHSVHTEDVIEERAYHSDSKEDETYRPELAGKNLDRYTITWNSDRWISYGDWLAEPREPALFDGPRLLCRKILSKRLCCTYVEDDWLVDQQVYVASQFEGNYSPQYATAILASSLLGYYTRTKYHEDTELFPHIRVTQFRQLPIKRLNYEAETASDVSRFKSELDDYLESGCSIANIVETLRPELDCNSPMVQTALSILVENIIEIVERRQEFNLNLLDYVTTDPDHQTLNEIGRYQPPETASTGSQLYKTTEDLEKLRVGTVSCERADARTTIIYATARYKPEDPDARETDQYGYTETEPIEAFRLTDLTELEADLVETWIPVAAEEAGGFAGFRENATKTNSLVDRLKALALPEPEAVEGDLRNYLDARARADELDEKIERTDELIDEIVYELYGLTDEEIEIVEAAVSEE